MDSVSLLFRRIGKISGGRDSARRQRHAAVHDRHLYRPDFTRGSGFPSFRSDQIRSGHLVRMACRLDYRHGVVSLLLSESSENPLSSSITEFSFSQVHPVFPAKYSPILAIKASASCFIASGNAESTGAVSKLSVP